MPHWPGHRVVARHWDDEVVVYVEDSGNTHLFNGLSAEVLSTLAAWRDARPATEADLLAALDLSDDAETVTTLRAVLASLQDLGVLAGPRAGC